MLSDHFHRLPLKTFRHPRERPFGASARSALHRPALVICLTACSVASCPVFLGEVAADGFDELAANRCVSGRSSYQQSTLWLPQPSLPDALVRTMYGWCPGYCPRLRVGCDSKNRGSQGTSIHNLVSQRICMLGESHRNCHEAISQSGRSASPAITSLLSLID